MFERQPLWGDLHNHNSVGYGQGSLSRALRIAMQRLDVWGFTAHGSWSDMPPNLQDTSKQMHKTGFDKARSLWPQVVAELEEADRKPNFTAIAGFESHFTHTGDLHVLPSGFIEEMPSEKLSLQELHGWARQNEAVLIPHHLAYPPGARGVDWKSIDEELSPVAEVFSEHGCSEADDAPWPMDGHSMSPRCTPNTWQQGLLSGLRLGAVASSDNHEGCPGAYNEGLAGIWSENSREAIFDALRKRRCYAVTGDRIVLDWGLGDAVMGGTVRLKGDRAVPIWIKVIGWDALDSIDLILNDRILQRWTPGYNIRQRLDEGNEVGKVIVRAGFGWGNFSGGSVNHWDGHIKVVNGTILQAMPCFGSVPEREGSDGSFEIINDHELVFSARTSHRFVQPNDQIALEVVGGVTTTLETSVRCRSDRENLERQCTTTLGEMKKSSVELGMGDTPFTTRFQWKRALTAEACTLNHQEMLSIAASDRSKDFMYLRVRQRNGQMAWSSPIWIQR